MITNAQLPYAAISFFSFARLRRCAVGASSAAARGSIHDLCAGALCAATGEGELRSGVSDWVAASLPPVSAKNCGDGRGAEGGLSGAVLSIAATSAI